MDKKTKEEKQLTEEPFHCKPFLKSRSDTAKFY